jgi:cell division protein FtsN
VSTGRSRMTSRDYKHARRSDGVSLDLRRWRELGIGLAAGLAVAAVVYVSDHRAGDPAAEEASPQPRPTAKAREDAAKDRAAADEPAAQYDFYDMLPKFEVVVPEKDQDVRRDLPTAKVERPGVYVLQAGSYRSQADADRVKTQLGKMGIDAKVQRVAVDSDVWHRVRVGPVSNLDQLNRLRQQLRAADFDTLMIRVGD